MFEVDKYSRVPIYEQVINRVEALVANGELTEGGQLPSVRMLSQQLSVNPNTLQKAYMELERRGICQSVPGSGRFIAKNARSVLKDTSGPLMESFRSLCVKLKGRGVTREECVRAVNAVYDKNDDGLEVEK